jgi:hypothetical protein
VVAAVKKESFYRRSPADALSGMVGMTLEERGVYNTIIDLLYLTWRPLEDSRAYIAGHCGCAVQKLNPLIASLIAKRKLLHFEEGGVTYLSNRRFEDERTDVKGASSTRSGRAGVGEKSGEVGEKSEGVGKNPPPCADEATLIQVDTPLEKTRVEETREKPKALPGLSGLLDEIWNLASPKSRERSGREPLRKAVEAAVKQGHDPTRIRDGLAGYFASDDVSREGGKFAKGVHRLVADGRWEAFAGQAPAAHPLFPTASAADATKPSDARQRSWMEEFVRAGPNTWQPVRGPRPGEPNCRVSPEIQREFGIEPAAPRAVDGKAA